MSSIDDNVIDFRTAAARPDTAITFYNRGMALDRVRDCAKAIAAFSRAIELNPAFVDAYFKRSIVHRQNRDYAKAAADFDQAILILWQECPSAADQRSQVSSRHGFGGQQAGREAAAVAG